MDVHRRPAPRLLLVAGLAPACAVGILACSSTPSLDLSEPAVEEVEESRRWFVDILTPFELWESTPGMTHALTAPGNAGFIARVRNAADNESYEPIRALSGVVTLPADCQVLDVCFVDPARDQAPVAGVKVWRYLDRFEITDFPPMKSGDEYDLLVRFKTKPASGYRVSLTAGF